MVDATGDGRGQAGGRVSGGFPARRYQAQNHGAQMWARSNSGPTPRGCFFRRQWGEPASRGHHSAGEPRRECAARSAEGLLAPGPVAPGGMSWGEPRPVRHVCPPRPRAVALSASSPYRQRLSGRQAARQFIGSGGRSAGKAAVLARQSTAREEAATLRGAARSCLGMAARPGRLAATAAATGHRIALLCRSWSSTCPGANRPLRSQPLWRQDLARGAGIWALLTACSSALQVEPRLSKLIPGEVLSEGHSGASPAGHSTCPGGRAPLTMLTRS